MDVPALSGIDQVAAVRRGDVLARRLAAGYLDRASGNDLNTFTMLDPDQALLKAEQVDRAIATGESAGALAGMTLGLKDLIDQKGLPTTCGSSLYRKVPKQSAPVVRRLEKAGAVILGRNNLHEFAFGFSSENHWFGPVLNPWDRATSAGGSSGGTAAAVAAGLVSAGIGTDTGGSVRVPAAICGLVGLKVTHGRVPLTGVFPLAPSLDTVGPITRTVADAAAIYAAIAGPSPTDRHSVAEPLRTPESVDSLKGVVVGVPHPWVDEPVDPSLRMQFARGLAALEELGAEIRRIEEPLLCPPGMISESAYSEIAVTHRKWFPSRADEYGPEVADRLGEAMAVTVAESIAAGAWRTKVRETFFDVFRRVDLIATPAVASIHKLIGEDTVVVDGAEMHYRRAFSMFTALVNHGGNPAIVLPIPGAGRPGSIQLIGPEWSEHRLLEVGELLERTGAIGFRNPPNT